jgi:hypothetical protein
VPYTVHADAEQLLALPPDLIFVASYLRPEVVRVLQDAALPVFTLVLSVETIQRVFRVQARIHQDDASATPVLWFPL